MRRCTIPLMLAAAAFSLSFACNAEETLRAAELRRDCLAYQRNLMSVEGLSCFAYVRGFLDGASAIDSRVRPLPQADIETWSDRALRTRLGSGVRGKPTFCVKSGVLIKEVIVQLLTHSADHPHLDVLAAREILTQTLQRFHRC